MLVVHDTLKVIIGLRNGVTVSHAPAEQIVWIDCEMTGLDADRDGLCELAIIVTDFELTALHAGFEIVINPGVAALDQMSDFVRDMHTKSGLLSRIADGVTAGEAERAALKYLERFIGGGRKPLVAGNTISMDRRFIAKYLPGLDERLHYRSLDVSTIKELSRRWFPVAFGHSPQKRGGHRALADIAESIQELAYFRSCVLVEGAGPDRAGALGAAERVCARYAPLLEGVSEEPPR